MLHKLNIRIDRLPVDAFCLLCHRNTYEQQRKSPVASLEKTADGPVGVGTHYRQVLQMARSVRLRYFQYRAPKDIILYSLAHGVNG